MEKVVAEAPVAATVTAYESDVALLGQTIGTPSVNISGIQYTLGGSCTVVRNSVTIFNLFGNGWGIGDQTRGFSEQSTQDIVLTTVTSGGTVIIELSKVAGFNSSYQLRNV
jgi:hypothetical protein